MNVKLTRAQELHLIAVGLNTLLEGVAAPKKQHKAPWNKGKKISKSLKRKWSAEQHRKYAETMKKKWGK